MKFKILNLLSTVLLLVSSLSGGLTVMAEPKQVKPYSTWDYDTNNPSLSEYDQLLQNAGPSDGIVD
ncbi:MAG: hypothetical protein M3Z38_00005, partial [Bombilactobacillus mellifer]|nr:hypothetical protein [Bombilactobacillus mellifer]